jgi:hypothetical protein
MNPDRFVKVFDVLDSGFRDWTFSAFGLIFVAIGIVIAVFPKIIRATGIPFLDVQSRTRKFFRYSFLGFAVLWTTISFSGTYSQYLRHRALIQANACRIVEGPVEHFVPMPYGGHSFESFSVLGVSFRYSDFVITDGFNNTSFHGGPVNGDSYVRICYDPTGNNILRLEIRDFNGEPKSYSGWGGIFFPKAGDTRVVQAPNSQRPAISVPWYGNLILPFLVLNFVGVWTLFLPYLRTFFRIKTLPVQDCTVPVNLEPGKKIKLRNSMIYWDKENHAIWLRPRGFNLVQIPAMAAKLKVDPSEKSVIGQEIRFSSGVPFMVALLLLTMHELISATLPANTNGPSPALIVGFFGVVILIGGFVNLRMLRSRMEKLVEDALSDLRQM